MPGPLTVSAQWQGLERFGSLEVMCVLSIPFALGVLMLSPVARAAAADDEVREESVSLTVGQSAEVSGLTLTFSGVEGDNRCPKEVVCIVGGQATVMLHVEEGGEEEELRIDVPPDGEGTGRFRDQEITVGVEPAAQAGKRIAPGDYVATVTVDSGQA